MPPIVSGRDVVGAAIMAPVSACVRSLSDRADVIVIIPEHHPPLFPFLQFEAGGGSRLLYGPDERFRTGKGQDLVGAISSKEPGPKQLEPCRAGPILEARHECHLHRDLAAAAPELPMNFGVRPRGTAVLGHRHEVSETDGAAFSRLKRGLQDVGSRKVALARGPFAFRRDGPGSTTLRIEQRGKNAGAIKARQTAPIDA